MLEVNHIDQYYGGSHTLRDVSLTVRSGDVMALLGRNGVGKTTLLKCLMGVLPVAAGDVRFEGADITRLAPHRRAARGMAYVPQGRDIFARLTVEENILMGMATRSGRDARRIKGEIFELFPVLRTMLARRGGDLSGGQQQQLAIARALVAEPKLIILDEPTEGIQPSIIKDIGRAIRYLRDSTGMAILLVEQYLDFCRELADHVYIMDRGEIVHEGAAETLDTAEARRHLTV